MREQARKGSFAVALCALMAALGTVIMALGGLIPIATYCSPMIAGVLLLPVMSELGNRWAVMTWLVTALLSLLLSIDREAAFLYLFIGYYPILRPYLDAVSNSVLRFLLKLGFFTLALGVMYALMLWVLQLGEVLKEFGEFTLWMNIAFFAALVGVMMIFDTALARLHLYWLVKLRPRLKLPKQK